MTGCHVGASERAAPSICQILFIQRRLSLPETGREVRLKLVHLVAEEFILQADELFVLSLLLLEIAGEKLRLFVLLLSEEKIIGGKGEFLG